MRALSRNAIAQISCGSVDTTATAIWAFCFPSRPDRLARRGRLSFAMTQSPPLVGVNSPAGILLVRGRRRGGPTILSRTPINGTDTTSHCWQCWQCRHCWHLTVGCPSSLEQCQSCFGGSEDCHVSLVPSSRVQRMRILLDPGACSDVA